MLITVTKVGCFILSFINSSHLHSIYKAYERRMSDELWHGHNSYYSTLKNYFWNCLFHSIPSYINLAHSNAKKTKKDLH